MKCLMLSILMLLCILQPVEAQWVDSISGQDTLDRNKGAELKGLYYGGGGLGALGILYAFVFSKAYDANDEEVAHFTLATGAASVVVGSLLAAGISAGFAELLGRKHSSFNKSIQFGIGATYATIPLRTPFGNFLQPEYRPGFHFRVLSPELGHWKYSFSVNYVPTTIEKKRPLPPDYNDRFEIYDDYEYWLEYNLDIQYLIHLADKIMISPYLGSNISKYRSDYEWGANFGLGISYHLNKKWSLFADVKRTVNSIYEDEDEDAFIFAMGTQYYLK